MSSSASARFLSIATAKGKALGKSESSDQVRLRDLEDEALMARLQAGELGALEALYDRYAGLLLGISTRLLRNPTEAEDVVQETFFYLFRKHSAFKISKGSVRSWLVMVTYSRALDCCRQLKNRYQFNDGDPRRSVLNIIASSDHGPEKLGELSYWRSLLLEAFLDLSVEQRDTLRMHFFEGYTLLEISQKVGHPLGNIRNYYYRGLERLRKRLLKEQ
jgi:RNA polymerase sigma-70 factor, ECF subfamily